MKPRVILQAGIALSTAFVPALALAASVQFNTISLTGEPAPGTDGAIFAAHSNPFIGPSGDVVFAAQTTPEPGTNNNVGVFRSGVDGLNLIAFEGDIAPSPDGAAFTIVGSPTVDANGEVAFIGLAPPTPGADNDRGIFVGTPAGLQLVAFDGEPVPGTDNAAFVSLGNQAQGANGGIALQVTTTPEPGTSNDLGVVRFNADGLQLVAFEGDAAPGTDNTTFRFFRDANVGANGEVVFFAGTTLEPGTGNQRGIFQTNGSALEAVVYEGDAAPVTTTSRFTTFDNPAFGANDDVVFLANTTFEPGDPNNHGIFRSTDSGIERIVFEGEIAPGTGDQTFAAINTPVVGTGGAVAFTAVTTPIPSTDNDRGLFREGPGGLELVAFEGESAPGTDDAFRLIASPTLNRIGQLAFHAFIGDGTRQGLFATDPSGTLVSILLAGQAIPVGPNDVRTVVEFSRNVFIADDGTMAFSAAFDDGTGGVFTARIGGGIQPVPLPAGLPLLLTALVLLGVAGKRRKV